MAPQKDYFINSVELIDLQGSTNIPTVLLYRTDKAPVFGSEAIASAAEFDVLNEDFKVDLGNNKPGSASTRRFKTADGRARSAAELTSDFIHELLQQVTLWLEARDIQKGTNILIAEPLAMQQGLVSEGWLANYRNFLRRILNGKGFENIDFLPEPFAVYQYYRYQEKHPIVAERRKHYALVLDFGGGTFDACLIETTKEGDISQSGRQARPLSACSEPIGGFFVNRVIAEEVVRKVLSPKNIPPKINKGLELYRRWRRDGLDLTSFSAEHQNFIRNYHRLTYRVEEPKITLCRLIKSWDLDAPAPMSVPIPVPQDIFATSSPVVNLQFSAAELRAAFVSKVWQAHLRPIIQLALQRGKEGMSGAPITVVLLSGGSANIRWLTELLKRDFSGELQQAEILQLKDFQEVVSKGLAVECARRHYSGSKEGDFSSVTYNRLCLLLDPDNTGSQLKKFIPRDSDLPAPEVAGVLLPSASVLTRFRDKPMRWRVHLDSAPRRSLNYYFLRSSLDPDDTPNLQNVEEHIVHTPKNSKFDPDLTLELKVGEDGTATPRFIYRLGRTEQETICQEGRPFYLDMTTGGMTKSGTAFIGLDFGTSNTSVSFVNETSIQTYRRRSQEQYWNELSDLAASLPYPLAAPLAMYLCQTDRVRLASAAREFIESALTLMAYTAYQEFCSSKGRAETRIFKNFTKRSAGPLWKLLQDSLRQLGGDKTRFSVGFRELLDPGLFKDVDDAVNVVAQYKHGKLAEEAATVLRPVQILANISHRVFGEKGFGMFQDVQKQRFQKSYEGIFRHAHGRPPFVLVSEYRGTCAFSNNEAFVLNAESGRILGLEPLVLWEACPKHPDLENGHCYMFDCVENEGAFTYKAVGHSCVLSVGPGGAYSGVSELLREMMVRDLSLELPDVTVSPQD